MRRMVSAAAGMVLLMAGGAKGQETAPAASQPAAVVVTIDLSTPQTAVNSYLQCWQSGAKAEANLKKCLVPAGAKARLVENDILHRLWRNYVERAAMAKFGREEGLKVLGDARGYDEQLAIDLKRATYGNVDYDPIDKAVARVYLKPEKNPAWGGDPGEFGPRESYVLRHVGSEWRLDYMKTYKLDSSERAEGNRDALDLALYPRINKAFEALAAGIKAGRYATADDAKAVVTEAWTKVYDEATGGKGGGDTPEDKPATPETKPDEQPK